MVRAILDGSKTQTRRIVKSAGLYAIDAEYHGAETSKRELRNLATRCPHGQPGDRLWVRETWASPLRSCKPSEIPVGDPILYRADYPSDGKSGAKMWPSIYMPRWASRITLEIVNVRVERLQDMSEEAAESEGIDFIRSHPDLDETLTASQLFKALWESINGDGSWDKNPWVWVIEFKRIGGEA